MHLNLFQNGKSAQQYPMSKILQNIRQLCQWPQTNAFCVYQNMATFLKKFAKITLGIMLWKLFLLKMNFNSSLFFPEEDFPQNNWLSSTTPYGHLKPCWVSEKKTNGWIPRKRMNKQKDRWKNRQSLKSAEYYFLSLYSFVRISVVQEHNYRGKKTF